MYKRLEQTPYTRRQDSNLLPLTAVVQATPLERKPITASRAAMTENLQWVRIDMEIRLLAKRFTEAS